MYADNPEFRANYDKYRAGLADFMREAMTYYAEHELAARLTPKKPRPTPIDLPIQPSTSEVWQTSEVLRHGLPSASTPATSVAGGSEI